MDQSFVAPSSMCFQRVWDLSPFIKWSESPSLIKTGGTKRTLIILQSRSSRLLFAVLKCHSGNTGKLKSGLEAAGNLKKTQALLVSLERAISRSFNSPSWSFKGECVYRSRSGSDFRVRSGGERAFNNERAARIHISGSARPTDYNGSAWGGFVASQPSRVSEWVNNWLSAPTIHQLTFKSSEAVAFGSP